jgi:hypothetical protein
MSLKALADAVLERDTRAGQERDTPMNKCPNPDLENRASGTVIEVTLRPAIPWPELLAAVKPQNPEFPLCPDCDQARYWISPRGKVVCGKCGEVRFVLVAIQCHPVS